VLLADHVRVVHVLGRVKREHRVVVDELVELLGAEAEAGDNPTAVDALARPVGRPAFHEVDDPVRDHLGMDAEVLFIFEKAEQGLRDAPDAHLDGRAILDQRRQVLRELACLLRDFRGGTSRMGSSTGTSTSRS